MQKTANAANPPIMVNISSSQLDIEHPQGTAQIGKVGHRKPISGWNPDTEA